MDQIILGLTIFVIGLYMSYQQEVTWKKASKGVCIIGMALVMLAFFFGDPITNAPVTLDAFLIFQGMFFAYLWKIEYDMKRKLEKEMADLKADLIHIMGEKTGKKINS